MWREFYFFLFINGQKQIWKCSSSDEERGDAFYTYNTRSTPADLCFVAGRRRPILKDKNFYVKKLKRYYVGCTKFQQRKSHTRSKLYSDILKLIVFYRTSYIVLLSYTRRESYYRKRGCSFHRLRQSSYSDYTHKKQMNRLCFFYWIVVRHFWFLGLRDFRNIRATKKFENRRYYTVLRVWLCAFFMRNVRSRIFQRLRL